jgi:hypothetical protein
VEAPRLHGRRRADTRLGHRRKHRHVQHRQRAALRRSTCRVPPNWSAATARSSPCQTSTEASYPNYADLARENRAFTHLAATVSFQVSFAEGESARQVFVDAVSANYFAALAVGLRCGREFTVDEEWDGHQAPVVIVSYGFWQNRGADPDLLGRTVQIAGKAHTIVGIARGPSRATAP